MEIITKKKAKKKLGGFFNKFGKIEIDVSADSAPTFVKDTSQETQKPTFFNVSEFIFNLQKSGVVFHISPQFFETSGRPLIDAERQKLKINADQCLCHLHQAALIESIFREHKDFLEQFKYEVEERKSIFLEDETEDEQKANYDAVRLVSHEWFCHYLLTGELN